MMLEEESNSVHHCALQIVISLDEVKVVAQLCHLIYSRQEVMVNSDFWMLCGILSIRMFACHARAVLH